MVKAQIFKDAIDWVYSLRVGTKEVEPEVEDYLNGLVKEENVPLLAQWLHSDIIALCLEEKERDDKYALAARIYSRLHEDIKVTYIQYKGLLDELDVRISWKKTISVLARFKKEDAYYKALHNVSTVINYSFYDKDLYQLALVFSTTDKARYREIIKELLTDCNFHNTCEDFENGRFEDYLQVGLGS